jgi:hypothetical protein
MKATMVDQQMRDALDAVLQDLVSALAAGDGQCAWRYLRDALAWLYRCEESENGSVNYYTDRDANPDGQALAGLMWVRGLAEHHQAELQGRMLVSGGTFVKQADGSLVRVQPQMMKHGKLVPVSVRVLRSVWPARQQLPAGRRETHGRDVLYDQCVAGRQILEPLNEARRFLYRRLGSS